MIAFKRRSRGKKFTYTHHNIYIYIYPDVDVKKLNVIVKVTTVLIYFFGLRDR